MATTLEKKGLYQAAKSKRADLRAEERRAATIAVTDRAADRLRELPGLIGLYVAFGDELHPGRLIDRLVAGGRVVALPATPRWNAPLVFRRWAPGDPLVKGRMNIPEPAPDAPEVFPDVVVVPPVAFDRRCFRIGYGAGFYDRTLPTLRQRHPVFALGFSFACQEIEAVPEEPHDVPLNEIATEREMIVRASDVGPPA